MIGIPIVSSQSNGFLGNQKDQRSTCDSMKSLTLSSEIESEFYIARFEIRLTTDSPKRSFEVNSTVEYQGLLEIKVMQNAAANKKAYDVEWNDDSEYIFLLNKSSARYSNNATTDVDWSYYFSKNNTLSTQPLFITIMLREGFNNIPFTIVFYYNFHFTRKLTLDDPNITMDFGFSHDISYFNDTRVMIVSITSNSSSNVIFHVEGGYTEDNKNYTLFPGQTFIHFMKIRIRNESELTNSFYGVNAFPFYSFELENIDGSATIHYLEFNYVEDPSVSHGNDLSPLIIILILSGFSLLSICVCLILSMVILLNDWRIKRKNKQD